MAEANFSENMAVICGMCKGTFTLDTVGMHECFKGATDAELMLDGNVINYEEFQAPPNNGGNNANERNDSVQATGIQLDSSGVATYSNHNLIHLAELVRESRCIWDFSLPLAERSPGRIAERWVEIAKSFPGWSPQITKTRFANLKASYKRR
ncbi:uncharacterized protein LOC127278482 [Leptopilina boulardi]|uniref:uncharacterized protein LOC127278482 n=1 Tax=Leptopilina boulardi TaxID=63433 RepID=UPI0021F5F841|nr:uncharacterized protein LOC127278482 [Leptopilina boulardi]